MNECTPLTSCPDRCKSEPPRSHGAFSAGERSQSCPPEFHVKSHLNFDHKSIESENEDAIDATSAASNRSSPSVVICSPPPSYRAIVRPVSPANARQQESRFARTQHSASSTSQRHRHESISSDGDDPQDPLTADHFTDENWSEVRMSREIRGRNGATVWYPTQGAFGMYAPPAALRHEARVDELYAHTDLRTGVTRYWALCSDCLTWKRVKHGSQQPSGGGRMLRVLRNGDLSWVKQRTWDVYTSRRRVGRRAKAAKEAALVSDKTLCGIELA